MSSDESEDEIFFGQLTLKDVRKALGFRDGNKQENNMSTSVPREESNFENNNTNEVRDQDLVATGATANSFENRVSLVEQVSEEILDEPPLIPATGCASTIPPHTSPVFNLRKEEMEPGVVFLNGESGLESCVDADSVQSRSDENSDWSHAVALSDKTSISDEAQPELSLDSLVFSENESLTNNDTMEEMEQMLKFGMDYVLSGRDSYATPVKDTSPCGKNEQLSTSKFQLSDVNSLLTTEDLAVIQKLGETSQTYSSTCSTSNLSTVSVPSKNARKGSKIPSLLKHDKTEINQSSSRNMEILKPVATFPSANTSNDSLRDTIQRQLSELYSAKSNHIKTPSKGTFSNKKASDKCATNLKMSTTHTRNLVSPNLFKTPTEKKFKNHFSPTGGTPLRSRPRPIISPIGLYIHKSGVSPLVKTIPKSTSKWAYFDEPVIKNENKSIGANPLPKCAYRSAANVQVLEENTINLPKNIKKFFPTPKLVIKHERRIHQGINSPNQDTVSNDDNVPASPIVNKRKPFPILKTVRGRIENNDRTINDSINLLNDTEIIYNASIDNDLSIRVVREALRK